MRKFFAWLGAAALVVVSLMGSAQAAGPTVLKPYIVLILDVSGSMSNATNSGPPSCSSPGGGTLPDTKLNHARCAINNIVNTYGDIVFAFARFHETGGTGGGGTCGFNAGSPTNCTLAQDACTTNSDRFQLVTALDDHHCSTTTTKECSVNADCPGVETCVASNPTNAAKTGTWSDFSCGTCSQAIPLGAGTDPETWNAAGSTPIQGSLAGAGCYWAGLNANNGGCSAAAGTVLWPAATPGYQPIANDPTDLQFLPAGCNPSPSCFATAIAASPGGATHAGAVATYTTTTAHGLKVGDVVSIVGVGVAAYNGASLTVTGVPTATTFTVTLGSTPGSNSGGGTELLANTTSCCQTQCRPYITIMLTDGDETCGGTAGHCSNAVATGCDVDGDCGAGNTCVYSAGTCSVTTTTSCYLNGDCPQGQTCQHSPSIMSTAAAMLHTVVSDGAPAIAKQYRVQTKPIGFGTPAPYGPIENLALAGGAIPVPGQNAGFYAQDEAGLELAISQIIEGSVRSELCNAQDDDCDGFVDEDFPCVSSCTGPNCNAACNACDDGGKGVCKGTGTFGCSADGTGSVCNITSPGQPAQTTCPVGKTCNPAGDETCGDGLDNDCDGFVDEGCTVCNPIAEICNGRDDDCDSSVDEGIPPKQCGAFPGAACSPNAGCCGTQSCVAGAYTACNNTWTPTGEICNNIDDDCDGLVDEDLTQTCSNITGNGCGAAPCPETNNPGDPMVYHCTGLQTACTGPADMTCPGGVACVPPIPQNQCHPGTEQCTAGVFGTCNGEVQPVAEICDGLDNDCDNIIDEGTGGGACNATCGVGTIICAGSPADPGTCCQPGTCMPGQHQCGTLYCSAVSVTNDYTCNGVDEDCDGKVDEDWVCGDFHCASDNAPCTGLADTSCSTGAGGCVATPSQTCNCTAGNICNGQNKCITGSIMCQGTPIDPSSCCDCSGTPQNGQCSGGAQCAADCQCAYPCSGGEFPCPSGKKCDMSGGSPGLCVPDPCFGVSCTNDTMGNAQQCVDATGTGGCVPTCGYYCAKPTLPTNGQVQQCTGPGDTSCPGGSQCLPVTTCPSGLRCYGPTGQCDPDDCTAPFPDRKCAQNQSCIVDPNTGVGTCVTNPCFGVTCPSDQYCEAGACIASCAGKNCPSGQRCRLGACEPDPCGHPCPAGRVCNDATGACIDDPCQFRNCPQGQWCNSNDGMCEPDPCVGTMCPADPPGQVCKGGTCYNPSDLNGDAGTGTHVTVGGGGCSTGDSSGGGLLLILGVLLVRRRRSGGAQ